MQIQRSNNKAFQNKHREESKKGMRELRKRRKQAAAAAAAVAETQYNSTGPFASCQTCGKAFKCARTSLPESPRKRHAIVRELAKR